VLACARWLIDAHAQMMGQSPPLAQVMWHDGAMMKPQALAQGRLFVVATPIGNLADISARAIAVLGSVALIAAEDTRHTLRLLQAHGVSTPMCSLHEHNELERCTGLVRRLLEGADLALVSDAGTPLISDPGYRLVGAAIAAGVDVVTVPGPSAVMAALSVAGLPTDRFVFEGFLPSRAGQRRQRLAALATETRTLVVLESAHRVLATLTDVCAVFGADRQIAVGRELTKRHETVLRGSVDAVLRRVDADADQQRGEFTLVIAGAAESAPTSIDGDLLLRELLQELPASRAAALAARLLGGDRKHWYARTLALQAD